MRLCLFLGILIVADIALGSVFKLYNFTKGGEIGKIHSIMARETPELVIMGSSRAAHHYDPNILQDSLQLQSYNAGLDGQGTVVAYGFLNGLSKRKYPQVIICEITPTFDLFLGNSPVSTNDFYPYLSNDSIRTVILDFDHQEKVKLMSNSYRLNSSLFRLLPSILLNRKYSPNGYAPLYGTIDNNLKPKRDITKKYSVDPVREKYLRKFIEQSLNNGCELIFAISPNFGGADEDLYKKEIEIIKEYGIVILDHLNDSRFIDNPNYFKDRSHLNSLGATIYTQIISQEVKSCLHKSNND